MKKIKIILAIVLAAYLLGSFYELYQINQKIDYLERVDFLMNEGYTRAAAYHIAQVEFKLIPEDEEYIALMED